jgi:16S rRNA (adenine1518-N6/adenine1519-N6)-dimethyltransferase
MVRLGQNFLADPNLLDAIVRESAVGEGDVVLEVGGGEGALTERLAPVVQRVWVVELDRGLEEALGAVATEHPNVQVVWGDAMDVELGELDPAPTRVVSNLPYSIATPLILRTIRELPSVAEWTVMVQREIADRLRAGPGSRTYGAPTVVAQLACEVELLRGVDRAVFKPRPRVDSALLQLRRFGAAAPPWATALVRAAFGHRRKTLAGSLELAGVAERGRVREALAGMGLDVDARAESLQPQDFVVLGTRLGLAD